MPFAYNGDLVPRAKEMRRDMTLQERKLWYGFLQPHRLRIRRQVVIDQYIVDFYCCQARLIIEVDGRQHQQPDAVEYDSIRTKTMNQLGLKVLRFTNDEIACQFESVCQAIEDALNEGASD